jgi:hypothetical protein
MQLFYFTCPGNVSSGKYSPSFASRMCSLGTCDSMAVIYDGMGRRER